MRIRKRPTVKRAEIKLLIPVPVPENNQKITPPTHRRLSRAQASTRLARMQRAASSGVDPASSGSLKRKRPGGADFVDQSDQHHHITDLPFLIGRGEHCHLRLFGKLVSRTQAKVSMTEHGSYMLEDLSSNGCWIDGQRMKRDSPPIALHDGALVVFGGVAEGGASFTFTDPPHAAVDGDVGKKVLLGAGGDEGDESGDDSSSSVDSEEDEALRCFFASREDEDERMPWGEREVVGNAPSAMDTPPTLSQQTAAAREAQERDEAAALPEAARAEPIATRHLLHPLPPQPPQPQPQPQQAAEAPFQSVEELIEGPSAAAGPSVPARSGSSTGTALAVPVQPVAAQTAPPMPPSADPPMAPPPVLRTPATVDASASTSAVSGGFDGFQPRPRDAKKVVASRSANWLEGADGGQLASRWGAPPFSVLDARKGYWKERRRFWEQTYRIDSGCGRKDNLLGYKGLGGSAARGTSIFCPVLCELVYRWFCPASGTVLDPFAGGSVRGCVAARLGLRYHGVDLSQTQLEENVQQAARMRGIAAAAKARWVDPTWHCADSRQLRALEALQGLPPVDFVFSCPPYFDLENYSDDPLDLSNADSYDAFLASYREIIAASVARLAPNRFCCFVVGEIRSSDGFCRNFVSDTIDAFQARGAKLYNSAIMMLPLHSLPMRASAAFSATAKLGMCHQHVLVFYNGRHPNKDVKTMGLTNASRMIEWY